VDTKSVPFTFCSPRGWGVKTTFLAQRVNLKPVLPRIRFSNRASNRKPSLLRRRFLPDTAMKMGTDVAAKDGSVRFVWKQFFVLVVGPSLFQ